MNREEYLERAAARRARILELVGEGHTLREIAAELEVSLETVKWHVRALRRSHGAANVRELGRLARKGATQ